VYILRSFLNHSCDANSEMVKCEDGKDVIIAQKCIKAGEEITINYRPELAMMKRDKRQNIFLMSIIFLAIAKFVRMMIVI